MSLGLNLGLTLSAQGRSGPRVVITASSVSEDAPIGTIVGDLLVAGGDGPYTFSITADPDNKFELVGGNQIRTTATFEREGPTGQSSHAVTVEATGTNPPPPRTINVGVTNVFEGPTFGTLTLSVSTATQGEEATINILGATLGSTIAGTVPDGMTLDSGARTITGTPTVVGEFAFDLFESGLDSEPRASSVSITVEEPASGPPPLGLIIYGQSQALRLRDVNDANAETPHPDTELWDRTSGQFVTPVGNGLIALLNKYQADTGRPVQAVVGGQGGVPISFLQKDSPDTDAYEDLLADINASGIDPQIIHFEQGEGDAAGTASAAPTWPAAVDTLHGSLATDLGKTRATLPIVISSLATTTDASIQTDAAWDLMQNNIANIEATYPNIYFSHSKVPSELSDSFHFPGVEYARNAVLLAQTGLFAFGESSDKPSFTLDPVAERISATQTRVRLIHGLGTDFTPTTGITGFEVRLAATGSYVTATGVRESAASIVLTHDDLGTAARLVEYQQGRLPDISGAVFDNSPLAVPLEYPVAALQAEGEAAVPVLTYQNQVIIDQGQSQSFNITLPQTISEESLCIISLSGPNFANIGNRTMQITAQPSGTVVTVTRVNESTVGQQPAAFKFQGPVPSGTSSVDIAIDFGTPPFGRVTYTAYTTPTSSLTSTTPVAEPAGASSVSSLNDDVATLAGGFTIALGQIAAAGGIWSPIAGDETYVRRGLDANSDFFGYIIGDAQDVSDDPASGVTISNSLTNNMALLLTSWR